jgi:hypothetical protein
MLFNQSSLKEPLPVYRDSQLRQPQLSRFRGDGNTLHGADGSAGLAVFPTMLQPQVLTAHDDTLVLTRFRGPTRTSQMIINESIRPDIAQRLPLASEPRPAPSRLNDLVKETVQTVQEAEFHGVHRAKRDVESESRLLTTAMTHDGKRRATELQARAILPPEQDWAYRPSQQLQNAGLASRFAAAPARDLKEPQQAAEPPPAAAA